MGDPPRNENLAVFGTISLGDSANRILYLALDDPEHFIVRFVPVRRDVRNIAISANVNSCHPMRVVEERLVCDDELVNARGKAEDERTMVCPRPIVMVCGCLVSSSLLAM